VGRCPPKAMLRGSRHVEWMGSFLQQAAPPLEGTKGAAKQSRRTGSGRAVHACQWRSKMSWLTVSIVCSRAEGSDRTTVLQAGDHPFVRWETVAYYQDARVVMVHQLEDLLAAGVATPREPCSRALIARVQQGCLTSPRIEPWIRETCRAAM
jgi:hypothetical protein